MITFVDFPLPVVTEQGDGYVLYVKENGMFENDEWCVCMTVDGSVKHFVSSQIKVWRNETYGIKKKSSD